MPDPGSISDIVRSFFEARKHGEDATALALLEPDAALDLSESNSPYRGVYGGRTAIQELWADMGESWSKDWLEIEREVVAGDRVVVGLRHHIRGRTSGIDADARGAQVITVRGGAIVAFKLFQTMHDALAAVGLPEE